MTHKSLSSLDEAFRERLACPQNTLAVTKMWLDIPQTTVDMQRGPRIFS